ncbi:S8 family serine peptidase [Lactobacillus kefiranofaciens]|nr:S8 family serine peptidase [Lactobacillus kefiranofaciens]WQH37097.1 S8 family serine peptidase [Lactobacillus kefiranofaciens]
MAVAVIDSGVDTTHKDFQTAPKNPKFSKEDMEKIISKLGHGRYVSPKFPYVHNMITGDDDQIKENDKATAPEGEGPHGQHVAGIIAADGHSNSDHNEYVVGVAPEAQLMFLKYFSDDGTTGDVAESIYDAVNAGADVISLSLNSAPNVPNMNNADQKAIRYAIDHGVVGCFYLSI